MTKRRIGLKNSGLLIATGIALFAFLISACTSPASPNASGSESSPAAPTENETSAAADNLTPGKGTTIRMARAGWDTDWILNSIFTVLLEDLGYKIDDIGALDNAPFFVSAARGDVDFWPSGWFPTHQTYIEDPKVAQNVELVGYVVKAGALQGYLIDKNTAETHNIKYLEQLLDPEVAKLFDGNGNGKADLIGCPPGWGCELIIEHQMDAYGLRDTVEHVQGEYNITMGQTVARAQQNKPILYYTWTPNWTVGKLVPGQDVVWLQVQEAHLPSELQALESATTLPGVEGCADDPCAMGMPGNDIRVVANVNFLAKNPAAKKLFELVEVPMADMAAQNVKMFDGEDSDADLRRHAEEWIAQNRIQVDEWLAAARAAAKG